MASRRKELQEDAKLRVMQIINQNPKSTSREIAQKVGISNGSAYYLLTSLIDTGLVKILNFNESSQKLKYYYLLTIYHLYFLFSNDKKSILFIT